ncbi:PTS sugar transporter subunit IIB [Shimazuella alba]|jgi:PTS system cellobiose-specific IIB component|uniref:PTS sugar transporter subunit IIB n=1 Tax=Shimazuella alba TaxID=2690964 RepID=A0A6I4VZ52_9BACL|nr:PTS sugar transporter subunit IIB [Shimazuella alba]MXQ55230.1 PTS sugar transporter subunit IIB [Shimazuella alba]
MKIILACDAGMSTSIMVTKMKKAADEKGLDADIQAIPLKFLDENMEGTDVVLLGPQMKYTLSKVQTRLADLHIPVDVINSLDYGMMRGDKILEQALQLAKSSTE